MLHPFPPTAGDLILQCLTPLRSFRKLRGAARTARRGWEWEDCQPESSRSPPTRLLSPFFFVGDLLQCTEVDLTDVSREASAFYGTHAAERRGLPELQVDRNSCKYKQKKEAQKMSQLAATDYVSIQIPSH